MLMRKKLTLLLSALVMGCTAALAEAITVTVDYDNGTILRGGTTASSAGAWCSTWQSSISIDETPAIDISGQTTTNNLTCYATSSEGGIAFAAGSGATSFTFNVTAPTGYVIGSLSANMVAETTSNLPTVTVNGTDYEATATAQSIQQENINKNTFTIVISGSAVNSRARFNDFTMTVMSYEDAGIDTSNGIMGSTTVEQGKVTTGIGNKDQGIIRSTIVVEGDGESMPLTQVRGTIKATSLSDVSAVKAYLASNEQELYVDDPDHSISWREPNGTLLGKGTIQDDGTYTIDLADVSLPMGTNYLWIALDISDEATEGNTVDATITGYTAGGEEVDETSGDPTYSATIFLTESAVLMPMDNGTLYYRIPAITATADGKRLITLTDDRSNHNTDLPYQIYVMAQYSDDGGKTWSAPQCVAGTADKGGNYGHGDAELITNRITGEIVGIMTSSPTSNAGFYGSTVDNPQAWKVIKSSDGGETWTAPVDHTQSLYAHDSPNPNIKAGFSGSGAGLQKRDGTLVSPFVARDTDNTNHYYNIISKDGGDTWELYGTDGTTGSDEPKVLERNNGDLAISVRATGYNYHNVTPDDGLTWENTTPTRFDTGITGNACDGEYMVWASTLDGNPWNIAFQTLPYNSSRMNLSIALSTDEGETFLTPKTICPRGSAYSAAAVMSDGTLGVYYEENGIYGGFTMRFVRFSLDWASNGAYKFTDDEPFHPIQTKVTYSMSETGINTLMLPFDAELPNGLEAYTTTGEVKTLGSGDSTYRALVLDPYEGTTLKAHTGYIVTGEEGDYIFSKDKADWESTADTWNANLVDGVLRGWYANDRVSGDGATVYNNLRTYSATGDDAVFRRVTSGSQVSISAYNCSLQLTEGDELYLYPTTRDVADGVESVALSDSESEGVAYNLQGMPHRKGQREIVVLNGKKLLAE